VNLKIIKSLLGMFLFCTVTTTYAGEESKEVWIDRMSANLPTAFCQSKQFPRQCFEVTQIECEETALSATIICLEKYKEKIPNVLNHPKDGRHWGKIIGRCAGDVYAAAFSKRRISSKKCNNPAKYQGNNFPPLSSEKFPSYSVNSPIIDGVEVKFPEGNGKVKQSVISVISKSSNSFTINSDIEWDWNIKYENKKIVSDFTYDLYANSQGKNKNLKMNVNCIHDTNGKEISMDVIVSDKDNDFTVGELDEIKREMPAYINQQYAKIGKTVKTGDILKEIPNKFNQLKTKSEASKSQSNFPEIVKGWGNYKNKKVVVTEYILEDRIARPGLIMEMRGKGYNLYDGESFTHVSGESRVYLNTFTPKEGTMESIIDSELNATDYQIYRVIDSSKF